ncbi:peptidoglycan-binding LysM [Capnocytophaga sp. oral taxon 902]|jgi:peptidoglycan-binding lysM|uniref:Peptidoglycan-binding LysM n=1 Tax=Capnocytophaga ochracea TaxID=1018 RepID=A0AA47A086_CAPOC|nr:MULTISPECIES: peptidoglycan-binding LysM [Capnocytophaga]QLF50603.1 peptidoglycan-binding LysM [Capnocytophaga sp. oral taxon 902]UZD41993.1 peptidoglycan-binding LysM [Capnocytophaga ochracea]
MKKIFLALIAIATFVACSKDNGGSEEGVSAKHPKKIISTSPYLRVERIFELYDDARPKKESYTHYQADTVSYSSVTEYEYDGKRPVKERYGDTEVSFFYNKGKLEREVSKSKYNSTPSTTEYQYDGNGRVIKKLTRYRQDNYEEVNYQYSEGNKIIASTERFVENKKIYSSRTYTLDANGNVVKQEYKDYKDYDIVITYEYDNKINPLFSPTFRDLYPDYFTTGVSRNNIIKRTEIGTNPKEPNKISKETFRTVYEYNGDYPVRDTHYSVPNEENKPEEKLSVTEYIY